MLNVIVTGGRTNNDIANIDRCIHAFVKNKPYGLHFYIGDCPSGVDYIARKTCDMYDIDYSVFVADWHKYGRAAGPRRNRKMVDAANNADGITVCLSFEGGRGTQHCTNYAAAKNIRILRV